MPKYLMFDHGGVLDGDAVGDLSEVDHEKDLILQEFEWGGAQVLKNGVQIVQDLHELMDKHGYEMVFHSKNKEADQIEILEQLQRACSKKGLRFPRVRAMAVFDQKKYPRVNSSRPGRLETTCDRQAIGMVAWGEDDLDGKASVRRALESFLSIPQASRSEHVVFDDGEPNVSAPRAEGYQAHLIGVGHGRVKLDVAIAQVLAQAKAAKKRVEAKGAPAAAAAPRGGGGGGGGAEERKEGGTEPRPRVAAPAPVGSAELDPEIAEFVLTQSSVNQGLIYDQIQRLIFDAQKNLQTAVINATIINVALNIDGKIVLAQVYIERKNGFAASPGDKFGGSPTHFNVQVRFPFGFETTINGERVVLPSGPFKRNTGLSPGDLRVGNNPNTRSIGTDYPFDGLVLGDGVRCTYSQDTGKMALQCDGGETVKLQIPLLGEGRARNLLAIFDEGKLEQVESPDVRRRWQHQRELGRGKAFLLDLTIVNGMTLFTRSGFPLTSRLHDYQVELLNQCKKFAESANCHNARSPVARAGADPHLKAKVGMGVGAGKTFVTYTLLQQMRAGIKKGTLSHLPPPFCAAPTPAVAEVTTKAINKQGLKSGTSAVAVSSARDIPNASVIAAYQRVSERAGAEVIALDLFLRDALQQQIIAFCEHYGLHPNTLVDLVYMDGEETFKLFRDSIDPRRLLLLVEAQKTMMDKTGMLGIEALRNILEQLKQIQSSVIREQRTKGAASLYPDRRPTLTRVEINYSQPFDTPGFLRRMPGLPPAFREKINLTAFCDPTFLKKCIEHRAAGATSVNKSCRTVLRQLACLVNKDAAILQANSGGLGSTLTDAEIREDINRMLPLACLALRRLIDKRPQTLQDQYTMSKYVRSIFADYVPEFKYPEGSESEIKTNALGFNLQLIEELKTSVDRKLAELPKVTPEDARLLEKYGITPETNCIDAAQAMSGVIGLRATGVSGESQQSLLLAHPSVYTPEGFAAYIEALTQLEGQKAVHIEEVLSEDRRGLGVYLAPFRGKITLDQIKARLHEVLSTIMLADEAHMAEYDFLSDVHHPIHQRIHAVTMRLFNKPFVDLLPHRIGMSGTLNEHAEDAFGSDTLYDLSTPKMMQKGMLKKVEITSVTPDYTDGAAGLDELAQQIVAEYFCDNGDLFKVSKGLLFSKIPNPALKERINYYFQLLFDETLTNRERNKLSERIFSLHLSRDLEKGAAELWEVPRMQTILGDAFEDHMFAVYLEFILSKSQTKEQMSAVVGLQNNLHDNGKRLTQLFDTDERVSGVSAVLTSFRSVMPDDIKNRAEVERFVNARLTNPVQRSRLTDLIWRNKADHRRCIADLRTWRTELPFPSLITDRKEAFESGMTLAMFGTEEERVGYSHEPVGIVMDIPGNSENLARLNHCVAAIHPKGTVDVLVLRASLVELLKDTLSYDEKNQAGGRALRTPKGRARYVEFLSKLNELIQKNAGAGSLRGLKLETPFADIFSIDEAHAKRERASIGFNRALYSMIHHPDIVAGTACRTLGEFCDVLRERFRRELDLERDPTGQTKALYEAFIMERLPLAWAISREPALAQRYFKDLNEARLNPLREQLMAHIARPRLAKDARPAARGPEVAATKLPEPSRGGSGGGSSERGAAMKAALPKAPPPEKPSGAPRTGQ